MKMMIQRYERDMNTKDLNEPEEVKTEIENLERDHSDQITLYGTEKDGTLFVVYLDQATVDKIKTV